MNKVTDFLKLLRALDENGQVSLTNMGLIGSLVLLFTSTDPKIAAIVFAIAVGAYCFKRFVLHQKYVLDQTNLSASNAHSNALTEVAMAVEGVNAELAGLKSAVPVIQAAVEKHTTELNSLKLNELSKISAPFSGVLGSTVKPK